MSILKFITDLISKIKADPMQYAIYAGACVGGVILLVIVLKIIIACVKHSKKKKAIANGTYVRPLTRAEEKAKERAEKEQKKAEKLARKQSKNQPKVDEVAPVETKEEAIPQETVVEEKQEVVSEETPIAEEKIEEQPVEEISVVEEKVEEKPVEETPVVEEKVEEKPVEETPVVEEKAETPKQEEVKEEKQVEEAPTNVEGVEAAEKYIPLGPLVSQPSGDYQEFFKEDGSALAEVVSEEAVKPKKPKKVTYNYSFEAKIILGDEKVKKHYSIIKNFIASYKSSHGRHIPDNKQWSAEIFGASTRYGKLRFNKSTLVLALPLNPNTQDEKYSVTASDLTTDQATPCIYALTSDRACKLACELMSKILEGNGYSKDASYVEEDLAPIAEDEKALIARGLIKVNGTLPEEPVKEEPKQEKSPKAPVKSAPVKTEKADVEKVKEEKPASNNVKKTQIKCNFSFEAQLYQMNDNIKAYYSNLRNHLDSYGVVSDMAWKNENFVINGQKVAMLRGNRKELVLNTSLPMEEVKPKFKAINDVANAELPSCVKVYTDTGLELAKELLDMVFAKVGAVKNPDAKAVDYVAEHPFIYTKELIKKGLVKEVSDKK